jgi:hypothetical protein
MMKQLEKEPEKENKQQQTSNKIEETRSVKLSIQAYKILQSWTPKHYTYTQYLSRIITDRLGTEMKKVTIPNKKGNSLEEIEI